MHRSDLGYQLTLFSVPPSERAYSGESWERCCIPLCPLLRPFTASFIR